MHSFFNFPFISKSIQNILQKRLHIFRNIAFLKSPYRKFQIQLFFDLNHAIQPSPINFQPCRFISLNHGLEEPFRIETLYRSADNG